MPNNKSRTTQSIKFKSQRNQIYTHIVQINQIGALIGGHMTCDGASRKKNTETHTHTHHFIEFMRRRKAVSHCNIDLWCIGAIYWHPEYFHCFKLRFRVRTDLEMDGCQKSWKLNVFARFSTMNMVLPYHSRSKTHTINEALKLFWFSMRMTQSCPRLTNSGKRWMVTLKYENYTGHSIRRPVSLRHRNSIFQWNWNARQNYIC